MTVEQKARELLASSLEGYARAYDKLHCDVADDFRRAAEIVRKSTLPDEERIRRLEGALKWALPLAERALEDHRTLRLSAGHHDIRGTDSRGNIVIGLWQGEVNERDNARSALTSSPTGGEDDGV